MGKGSWLWRAQIDGAPVVARRDATGIAARPIPDSAVDDLSGFALRVVEAGAADPFGLYPDMAETLAGDGCLDPLEGN